MYSLIMLTTFALIVGILIFIFMIADDDKNKEKEKDAGMKDGDSEVMDTSLSGTACMQQSRLTSFGQICGEGYSPDVKCIDCRDLTVANCSSYTECELRTERNILGKLSQKCYGKIGPPTAYDKKSEHCHKLDNESCKADPYCFVPVNEKDINRVKAEAAFIGNNSHPDSNYTETQKSEWLQSEVIFSGRSCLPLKCESLSGEACMKAATDDTTSDDSHKRHCTVADTSFPISCVSTSDGCQNFVSL